MTSNTTSANMANKSEGEPGFNIMPWFPIMMGFFCLMSIALFGAAIYSSGKKHRRRRLQNLQEGKCVNKALEDWFSDPETTITKLTSRKPGRERTREAYEITDFYTTTQVFMVEFFTWAKEQKDEERICKEMGRPWCGKLRRILHLRKQALAKVSEEISNMPMKGERFMAVRDLYWEHDELQEHIKDFWSNGWADYALEYAMEEKYGSVWVDAENELEDLSRASIERVPEAASYKDWADRSTRRNKRYWKFINLLGYRIGYCNADRLVEAQSRELDD